MKMKLYTTNVCIFVHTEQNMHSVQQWPFTQTQRYTLCKNHIAKNEDMWVQSITSAVLGGHEHYGVWLS